MNLLGDDNMRKLWQTIRIFWVGLFAGMKSTEDEILHQNGLDLEGGVGINQRITEKSVAKALLRGELTQEVIDLRHRTYVIAREATHYNYFSPTLAQKKGENNYKYAENSILKNENDVIVTIQDNKPIIETVTETLERIGENGKFIDKKKEYNINITRQSNTTPRFKLEDFIKKIVVKKGDNEYTAILDLYVSKYPDDKNMKSKPFIRELERIIDNGIKSDIFDINTINFETYKAYKLDDMIYFEFGDIQLKSIIEYEGSYIIQLITNILVGGEDRAEQFYSENMAKKYENKEKKNLTYFVDPESQIKTYVCADCGKTVIYDARALDSANASDDIGDGSITEYLDFEMTEYEFGRMLCKDCAQKAKEELYNKIINQK